MIEQLRSANQSKLKMALIAVGIASFFVGGALRAILNVGIIFLAVWIFIVIQGEKAQLDDK